MPQWSNRGLNLVSLFMNHDEALESMIRNHLFHKQRLIGLITCKRSWEPNPQEAELNQSQLGIATRTQETENRRVTALTGRTVTSKLNSNKEVLGSAVREAFSSPS
jgi:hypothetical protein